MPFSRESLVDRIRRIESAMEQRVPGLDARPRASVGNVVAREIGGQAFEMEGYLILQSRNLFTYSAEAAHLAQRVGLWNITRKPATFAAGQVAAAGTNGVEIPQGTRLVRSDGAEFEVTAADEIAAGTAALAVQAAVAGLAGNTAEGAKLTFMTPIAGVNAAALVAEGGLAGGTDQESDEDLRSRLWARQRTPPGAGNDNDYKAWVLATPGVTVARREGEEFMVWVYPLEQGDGTVVIRFMVEGDDGPRVPTAPEIAAVEAYIALQRPVGPEIFVIAPTVDAQDFEIEIVPDTPEVRTAVTAELRDFYRRVAVPGGTELISQIREAVSIAADETDNVVSVPNANVTHATGHIGALGDITWL